MQILGYLNGGFGEVESWRAEVRHNELRRAELQAIITAATPGYDAQARITTVIYLTVLSGFYAVQY